jgi:hypothetical protein
VEAYSNRYMTIYDDIFKMCKLKYQLGILVWIIFSPFAVFQSVETSTKFLQRQSIDNKGMANGRRNEGE